MNSALFNIPGLAEAVNSGLVVDSNKSTGGVDVVVGASYIVSFPSKRDSFN